MEYNFREIEKKWHEYWIANKVYKVEKNADKPKYYVLDMFPYPSGAGLHVGHPLGYIASDIYSRYKRLQGFNVLHPMGYDAYGLPAEQYAIQTGQHPEVTTKKNIARYREQMDKIGFSYDWNREIHTCDPEYYKWTQWAFIQMFNSYYCNDKKQARPISELVTAFEQSGTEGLNVACSEELHFTASEWKAKNDKEKQEILLNYRIAYRGETMVNWFEVCIGAILRGEYNNNDMEKFNQVKIAQIGQYAENVFFGKPCGLMDQTACAVGGVITIDFKDPAHPVVGQTAIDLAKHGFVMCISDTKGSHADLTDDYAAIRREMESVAEQFGKKVLREVDEDEFYKALPKLRKAVGDRAVVRAMHFYNDCRRAAQLCDAVREDDFDTFLRLIIEGGHSSFEFNQNAYSIKSPKEQGVPVALALSQRVLNGRGAWRLQGGGFAGTIQAFVPVDLLDAYKAAIDGCFGEGSCHVLNIRNYGAVPVTPDM